MISIINRLGIFLYCPEVDMVPLRRSPDPTQGSISVFLPCRTAGSKLLRGGAGGTGELGKVGGSTEHVLKHGMIEHAASKRAVALRVRCRLVPERISTKPALIGENARLISGCRALKGFVVAPGSCLRSYR